MADIFSKDKRSEIMSHIRSKETGAERIVFKYLRSNRVYFQKHYRRAIGTPDIALPRKKRAVFIDSEFWHGKTLEAMKATRHEDDFWIKKITRNMTRDKEQRDALRSKGWQILVIWEKDIKRKKTQQEILEKVKVFLLKS